MAGNMMNSSRSRGDKNVDNDLFDDGFFQHHRFKGNRKGGSPTGGRGVRRVIRKKERNAWMKDQQNTF